MSISLSEFSSDIIQAIKASDLGDILSQDNRLEWEEILEALPFIPVFYSHAAIDYQLVYQRSQGGSWQDISIILVHGKKACGVWPLSFSIIDNKPCLSSHGWPIMPPLFIKGLANKSRKTLIKKCQELLKKLCKIVNLAQWESAESFAGSVESGLSEWHLQAMTIGSSANIAHELYVDLLLDINEIRSYFRKSYKPLITLGLRSWNVEVLSEENETIWNEFRELHFQVSGQVTRSVESWDIQHQAIANGDAILVILRNEQGTMVGGGFFNITRDEGVYWIGAYDRTLFDKPLGHVVQFRAIEEMKLRGLKWYKIGARVYPTDAPTDKELSISEFKQGFATHFFPQYKLLCEIK